MNVIWNINVIRDGVSKVRNDKFYPYIINITLIESEIVKSWINLENLNI